MIPSPITISLEIQSGAPVFAKTRVPVAILFDYLRHGDTIAEFLHDFPSVSKEQVLDLLNSLDSGASADTAANPT